MLQLDSLRRHFVTGGAGFIGSHLVDRLLAEGKSVTVYDNLSTGRKEWVASHPQNANFRFVHADLLDRAALTSAIGEHDFVWHLAANADIPGGREKTDLDLNNGTIATYNLLDAMKSRKLSRLAYTSSSTVYGELSLSRVSEDVGPLLPISLYGASKLAGEGLLGAYSHLFGFQAWIFRFGNVMGNRMNHGVVYDFIKKLRKNPKQLEILGDGNQSKNYFLIEDCIDGMLYVISHTDSPVDVFNLGTESNVNVNEIARIVVEEMRLSDVTFHYTGGARGWPGDVPAVIYNVNKVKRFGWQARHTSAEAIRIATSRLIQELV